MKINESRAKAVHYGKQPTKSFGVNTKNSKFFRVMSDNLYSDKIGSIIRELACNAIDAQREAGTISQPFDVFLPCSKNPKFCIRDYGTGLSPESIENVYTNYFESTKDESDEDIGGFGLGAKTPFAYTDSFVVRSYHNGTLYTYTIAFSGDNPEYELQSSMPTDEPNGLEIYFDVDEEDFNEFSVKAYNIFIWLEHIPNVWGSSDEENGFFVTSELDNLRERIKSHRAKKTFEDNNLIFSPTETSNPFARRYGNGYGGSTLPSKVCVLQGGVIYPVKTDLTEKIRKLANMAPYSRAIILKCKIGDISLTPSRESIESNKKTIANIEKIIDRIEAKGEVIVSNFAKEIKGSKFAVAKRIQEIKMSHFNNFTYQGIDDFYLMAMKGDQAIFSTDFEQRFGVSLLDYLKKFDKFNGLTSEFVSDKFTGYVHPARYVHPRKVSNMNDLKMQPQSYKTVYVLLRESGVSAPISAVLKEIGLGSNDFAFVLDTYKSNLKDKTISKLDYLSAMKDKILQYFECDESDFKIIKESDYIKQVEKQKRTYSKNTYAIALAPFGSIYDTSRENRNDIDFLTKGTYLYAIKKGHSDCVITVGNKEIVMGREIASEIACQMIPLFDISFDSLIFVTKKELKDINAIATGDVINFGELIEKAANDTAKINKKMKAIKELHRFEKMKAVFNVNKNYLELFTRIGNDSDVKALKEYMTEYADYLDMNYFEARDNFMTTHGITPLSKTRDANAGHKIITDALYIFDYLVAREAINDNLVKTLRKAREEIEKFQPNIAVDAFKDENVVVKFPMLRLLFNRNQANLDDKTLADCIEYIELKKQKENKAVEQVKEETVAA